MSANDNADGGVPNEIDEQLNKTRRMLERVSAQRVKSIGAASLAHHSEHQRHEKRREPQRKSHGDGRRSSGLRHRKRRRTQHITSRQANNLVAACAYAEAIGCRLNVSIDIFWLYVFRPCRRRHTTFKMSAALVEVVRKTWFRVDYDMGQGNWGERSVTHPHPNACPPRGLRRMVSFKLHSRDRLNPKGGRHTTRPS